MTEQITPTPQTGLGAPSVLVEPGAHATAGTPATLRVHVRNLADAPRDVTVAVLGLDDGWACDPVLLPAVEADATASTDLVLHPVTGAMPGDYPFVVVVQATLPPTPGAAGVGAADGGIRPGGQPGVRPAAQTAGQPAGARAGQPAGEPAGPRPAQPSTRTGRWTAATAGAAGGAATSTTTSVVESVLTVDAPSEVLLTVEPADSRIRLRRRLAVVVSNTGVEPVDLSVETRTSRGLGLDLSARRLTVPGRQTVRLTATARNVRPQVLGHLDRRTFSVVAQGRQAPATFHGTVTARPLVGSGMLRVVALLMVVVLWGGGLLVALPWFTDRADQQTQAQPAATAAADPGSAGDGTGPDGTGPDGAPGDGTSDGSGAPGDGTLGDSGVRVGGVVTADDPSGVRVQIAPASIIPASSGAGAGASGSTPAPTSGGGGGGAAPAARTTSALPATSLSASLLPARAVPAAAQLVTSSSTGGSVSTDRSAQGDDSARAITKTSGLGLPLGALTANGAAASTGQPGSTGSTQPTSAVAATRSTQTGDDGAWAFAGLAPTLNYLVTVSKPGYQTVRHVVSGAEAAAAALDVTLVAGDGSLSGAVTGPGGVVVGGVEVVITDGTTTITTTTETSGAVGSWAVDGLSTPSTYLVTAQGAGLGAQSTLVTLEAGGSATAPLALQAGVAMLSGTVTGPDALGAVSGVGGATVTATGGEVTRTASTLTTGRPGAYSLVDLPVPGLYTLTVEAPGYATQTLQLDLGAESSAAPADVLLGSSSGVSQGTVRDTAGRALAGSGLTLSNGTDAYKTMSTSDGSGSFRFNGIVPGEYVLSAELFGHLTASTTVSVTPGGTVASDLVLTAVEGDGLVSTARIRGRASDARTNGQIDCGPLPAGQECLVTVSLTAQAADGTQRQVSVTTEPALEYLIPGADDTGLLPGLYELTVSAPGYESSTVKVNVPMGQTVSAGQVALFPSPSLTGTVLARIGSVPAGTCVVAVVEGSPVPTGPCAPTTGDGCEIGGARCAFTGVNGGYSIDNLPAGTYTVTVLPGDDEYQLSGSPAQVTLVPGDVRRVDATLDRLARLSVSVLVDRGTGAITPAGQATVTAVHVSDPTLPDVQVVAGTDGVAELTRLVAGEYRIDVAWNDGVAPLSGTISGLELSLNQERATQLVLTRAARAFSAILVSQMTAGAQTLVGGQTVEISGITRYDGVVPVRTSVTVTTATDGTFGTTTNPAAVTPSVGRLDLVSDKIDVVVPLSDAYKARSLTGLDFATNVTTVVELDPLGQPFSGSLRLEGIGSDSTLGQQATLEVVSSPPGVSGVRLTAGAGTVDGAAGTSVHPLTWNDVAQPEDGSGTYARPGTYTVRASLAGFEPVETSFSVALGGQAVAPPLALTLKRLATLRVRAQDCGTGTCTPVRGAEFTLAGNGSQQSAVAESDLDSVDFGALPSGEYTVVVRADGYARQEVTVTVAAGRTVAQPEIVSMTRLGTLTGTVRSTTAQTAGPPGPTDIVRALPGVLVTATKDGVSFSTVSGPDGRYRITGTARSPGLAEGGWTVTATLAGYAQLTPTAPVAVGAGAETPLDVDLRLVPVTFTVLVVDDLASSDEVPGLTVRLQNATSAPEPTCVYGRVGCEALTEGQYQFSGVLPVQSVLSISGADYRPLQLSVTPPVGQTSSTITVPLVATSNAIGGFVSGQRGAESPALLPEATVTLSSGGTEVATTTTEPDGSYLFSELPDGTYVVSASKGGYAPVSRTVVVTGGQAALVDLTLFQVTRSVTVTVSSTSDLTGALVALSADDPATTPAALAGQPLVRGSAATYTTVFNQVPEGAWTATFTGAAGHPWTTTAPLAAGATTLTTTITEVRLRLAATGPDTSVDLTVTVSGTATGGTGTVTEDRTVRVGGPAETLYLLAGSYTVTPSGADGATISPATATILPADLDRIVSFAVKGESSSVLTDPGQWTLGTEKTLLATVTDPQGQPATGPVTFTLDGTSLGSAAVDAAGQARITTALPAGAAAGTSRLTASYAGSTTLSASEASRDVTVVTAPTSTVLAAQPTAVTVGVASTLTATVTRSSGGTVSGGEVEFSVGGVVVATGAVGAGGTATASYTPAAVPGTTTGRQLTASFVGTASLAPSSATRTLTFTAGTTTTAASRSGTVVTATVSRAGATAASPFGGTVTFSTPPGVACGAVEVDADGTASCDLAGAAPGTYQVGATYGGTASWKSSTTTATVPVTVTAPPDGTP